MTPMIQHLAIFMLLFAGHALAGSPGDRAHRLATELRCPVCQNQTLADSNADLARDLKDEIHQQVAQGRSDEEIRRFMVQRYGDFVLYEPPLRAGTVLLWAGPFLLLGVGAAAGAWHIARARRASSMGGTLQERRT